MSHDGRKCGLDGSLEFKGYGKWLMSALLHAGCRIIIDQVHTLKEAIGRYAIKRVSVHDNFDPCYFDPRAKSKGRDGDIAKTITCQML